jgi:hypothetical protein
MTRPPLTLTMRLGRVPILGEVETIVAHELGELLGASLQRSATEPRSLACTSVISLTLASDHLHVQLGLGVDERTRDHLTEALLGGDTTVEAICDALREMANTAGGAVRRAALGDGIRLAMGLPTNDNVFSSEKRRTVFAITDENGLYLECVLAVSANVPTTVKVSELREGMVIVDDVVDSGGTRVAEGGSLLTQSTAEQINTVLDCSSEVEISKAQN